MQNDTRVKAVELRKLRAKIIQSKFTQPKIIKKTFSLQKTVSNLQAKTFFAIFDGFYYSDFKNACSAQQRS
jgi:hypothetical protein